MKNSDSEPEKVFPNTTSTPLKTKATTSKTTPVNSRNKNLYHSINNIQQIHRVGSHPLRPVGTHKIEKELRLTDLRRPDK